MMEVQQKQCYELVTYVSESIVAALYRWRQALACVRGMLLETDLRQLPRETMSKFPLNFNMECKGCLTISS